MLNPAVMTSEDRSEMAKTIAAEVGPRAFKACIGIDGQQQVGWQ